MASPRKLHKRQAPSRTGSDFSFSTQYSSSSTLVHEYLSTPPVRTPSKPWAVKALNQLGLKSKKSTVFNKGKKKDANDKEAESDNEKLQASIRTRTPPSSILDISKEPKPDNPDNEPENELDLLPECLPQMVQRSPSMNNLLQSKGTKERRFKDLRLASTPDLRLRSKRDSFEDPFYLETMISEFPRPPVHKPGDYAPRAPVNPRIRRQHSNFSYPTSRAYPERAKMQAKYWIDRPAPRDMLHFRESPSIMRTNSGQPRGL